MNAPTCNLKIVLFPDLSSQIKLSTPLLFKISNWDLALEYFEKLPAITRNVWLVFGFIIGSLGVIWPWKSALSVENEYKIVRYLPDYNHETFYAFIFILIGIAIVIFLSSYEKK